MVIAVAGKESTGSLIIRARGNSGTMLVSNRLVIARFAGSARYGVLEGDVVGGAALEDDGFRRPDRRKSRCSGAPKPAMAA